MSFSDGGLYSYGTCIMRFMEHEGKGFLLVNETSYSNSTSKHMSHARRAVNHQEQFKIGNIRRGDSLRCVTGKNLYEYALERSAENKQKSVKARTNKAWFLERSAAMLVEAQRVSDFFGLRMKVDGDSIVELIKQKEVAAKEHAEAMREARKRQEERDAERKKNALEDLERWMRGEPTQHGGWFRDLPVRLRCARPEDAEEGKSCVMEIQTSMGAIVPYDDGKRCFEFYMKVREGGWRRNGETFQVGPYQLDAANPDGLIAGCHRISHEELTRFATQEGWLRLS